MIHNESRIKLIKRHMKRILNRTSRRVFWGNLRRLTPVSNVYGIERGTPIDRYYIENFLRKNSKHIRGMVLEVMDNLYTKKFGRKQVTASDIMDIDKGNRKANIHADLRETKNLPRNKYDCIILTQVLQYIDDLDSAVESLHKMLKPKGFLLCTLPSVSRIDCVAKEEGDFWRFTKASAEYLFTKHFNRKKLEIKSLGNVFADVCFLEGISIEEIKQKELDHNDKNFPLLICIKAVK